MGEARDTQSQSMADRLGVGKADHSIIAARLAVGGDVGFRLQNPAEATHVNSIIGNSVVIKKGVKYPESPNRFKIIQWLKKHSRLDSHKKKDRLETAAQALPDTCNWIFTDKRFSYWRDGNSNRLWCYGNPGVGKTVLAAKIIRHLEKVVDRMRLGDENMRAVLYVYFDYQERENQTPAAILADLLSQMLSQKRYVSDDMTRKYDEWHGSEEMLGNQNYLRLLFSEAIAFQQIYLVLDGLDEYSDETKENRPQTLMDIIAQLPSNFKVLVMSRNDPTISKSLDFNGKIPIEAKTKDIAAFLEWRIGRSEVLKQTITAKFQTDDGATSKAYEGFVTKSRGNFLLAQLQMDAFEGRVGRGMGSIENFHGDWSYFYDVALQRIYAQQDSDKWKALATLSWVCYAARPLSIAELSQAVGGYRTADTIDGATLEAICAGLIIIDGSGTTRLLHHTVHEFLEQNEVFSLQSAHLSLARRCLRVLRERPNVQGIDNSQHLSSQRPAYLKYAADNWGYHVRRSQKDSAAWSLALEFLKDELSLSEATEYMDSIPTHLKSCRRDTTPRFTGLGRRYQGCEGYHPLHLAADEGYSWAVELLIRHCGNIDAEDNDGFSPLRLAFKSGHQNIITMLVDARADMNTPSSRDRWLILNTAASLGDDRLVRFLISRGADLNKRDGDGWTPIQLAVRYGRTETVHTLLEKGAELSSKDKLGDTLLHSFIKNWTNVTDKSLFWILVERGCPLELRDSEAFTPLQLAIACGNMSAAWLLVHKGANTGGKSWQGQTPLHTAVTYNQLPMVNFLLDQGADFEALDNQGFSPMHTAAALDRIAVMAAFICRGKGIDFRNKSGLTPLHIAAEKNRPAAVNLLLQNEADPDVGDRSDRTPLHLAIVEKSWDAAGLLVEAVQQLDKADHEQQCYLHLAAFSGGSSWSRRCSRPASQLTNAMSGAHPAACSHRRPRYHDRVPSHPEKGRREPRGCGRLQCAAPRGESRRGGPHTIADSQRR
ncbi:ankyrin [Apiospora hydei]|uniref:Ankyrin n=1 Tax=Apiospora hydei TaxID=1337664 RepID=A0ABR1VJD9_9PEZI